MSETSTLLEALRAHYIGPETFPGGVFLSEVQVPDGGTVRRADGVYLGFTKSRGHAIDVHEIKVSTADFRAELANPVKAEAWWRYSTRFWIVSPGPHITPIAELPFGWGLMCPRSRGRRFQIVVAPAIRQPEVDLPLLIEVAKKLDTMRAGAETAAWRKARDQFQEKVNEIYAQQRAEVANINPGDQRRLDAIARLEKAVGFDLDTFDGRNTVWSRANGHSATSDQFAEALRLAMQVIKDRDRAVWQMGQMLGHLEDARVDVQRAVASIGKSQAAYEKLRALDVEPS